MSVALWRHCSGLTSRFCAEGLPAAEGIALDEPFADVQLGPLQQSDSQLFNGFNGLHPQQLLLVGADCTLDAAVAFGGAYKRRTRLDSLRSNESRPSRWGSLRLGSEAPVWGPKDMRGFRPAALGAQTPANLRWNSRFCARLNDEIPIGTL